MLYGLNGNLFNGRLPDRVSRNKVIHEQENNGYNIITDGFIIDRVIRIKFNITELVII